MATGAASASSAGCAAVALARAGLSSSGVRSDSTAPSPSLASASGAIDAAELASLFKACGSPVSDARCRQLLAQFAPADGGGAAGGGAADAEAVSFDGFVEMMSAIERDGLLGDVGASLSAMFTFS